ncbi:DNA repair protein RecN [Saccharospirillum salsuginis]|uniref:DNA repair protein RecN n=1 Tax=Saccharospirillum salsuginis TaxID=418750 RepID=A0A918KBC3_9GAMM|nr:DNA repair protein RecN [Saccharospirillum salsuginis]GGX55260.1 DNA repair protein RecN [Saccharospirillum salsuginis]
MLHNLVIRNIAIADNIEIEWQQGMTSISGETGAGKSILLNGLALALGERADSSIVRHGEKRAEVTASFNVARIPDARAWLEERDLDQGDDCILRRTVSAEGRSRAYINGQPVPLGELKALGEDLIDVHSQHAHQSLLRTDTHLRLLDEYAGHDEALQTVKDAWIRWQGKARKYKQLKEQADDNSARQQLLEYQFDELSALALQEGEVEALEQEFRRYNQTETLVTEAYAARQLLESEEGGSDALGPLKQSLHRLQGLKDDNESLSNALELLDSALIQAQEAVNDLDQYLTSFEVDEERVRYVEDRLDRIHSLARKHQVRSEALPEHTAALAVELEQLTADVSGLDQLETEVAELEQAYQTAAEALSDQRLAAAERFGVEVMDKLNQLSMPGARFEAVCERLETPSPTGLNRVEFRVSMNQGQPLRTLAKVASGGELSRISLAIQVICAEHSTIPTLVFDEVDVGISGATAEIVGLMLRAVGERGQVICVTHLPQVAALGHHHCVVAKQQADNQTRTDIRPITEERRVDEIARMLGGIDITAQTRAHAEEMLMRHQRQH